MRLLGRPVLCGAALCMYLGIAGAAEDVQGFSGLRAGDRVLVPPPAVIVTAEGFSGDVSPLHEKTERAARKVEQAVRDQLRARNLIVERIPAAILEKHRVLLRTDHVRGRAVSRPQESVPNPLYRWSKAPPWYRPWTGSSVSRPQESVQNQGATVLGSGDAHESVDTVFRALREATGVRYGLFVTARGSELSKGAIAGGALWSYLTVLVTPGAPIVGMATRDNIGGEAVLVDLESGDAVWHNHEIPHGDRRGDLADDPDPDADEWVSWLLRRFPVVDAR